MKYMLLIYGNEQAWGDMDAASIRDPFGLRWSIMSRAEDLSEEESASRVAAWAATQGA